MVDPANEPLNIDTIFARLFEVTPPTTGQNSNAPIKYILLPQSKVTPNTAVSRTPNILSNSFTKTITFNPGPGTQTLNLPIGTSLIPTKMINKQVLGNKPGSTIIPPNKINLKVPPTPSTLPLIVQSPPIKSTKAEMTISSNQNQVNITPSGIDSGHQELTLNEPIKSPVLFDMNEDNINEMITAPPAKTIVTYSRISPKVTVKQFTQINEIKEKPSSSHNTPTATSTTTGINKSLTSQSVQPPVVNPSTSQLVQPIQSILATLPMQTIIPNNSQKSSPTIIPNRKRKAEMKITLDPKKKKDEHIAADSSSSVKIDDPSGKSSLSQEVFSSKNIQASDKAIISTAVHELKKLFARRELLLKQLNASCVALGKVEYKLTISGAPVDLQEMYARITSFQQQYETDLKRLDWSVSAMHKLYSELAPKDKMRSTEEILQDLIGPTEGIPDDPKAKYARFKSSPVKKSIPKPKVRSPKKPTKTVYYQGEEGCPALPLEERKVPDKPDPSDGKFHCGMCPKIFLKQISLAKHLEFDHPVSLELEKKLNTHRSPKLSYACQDCDKSFHSNIMLLIHRSNEHDASDELIRESRPISKRRTSDPRLLSGDDTRSASEDEVNLGRNTKSTPITTRNAKAVRRVQRPKRTTRNRANNNNKAKSKMIDGLDFLSDLTETLTQHNLRSNWHETELFDPDIPIECTGDNPIIPIKPLTEEEIAAYTSSAKH